MPIIGQFGKLSNQVIVTKGDPVNLPWEQIAVPGLVPTPVFTYVVPGMPNTKKFYLQGLSLASRTNCTIELRRNSVLVWEGGTGLAATDLPPISFADGEILGDPDDTFELRILHTYVSPLRFAGNIFGYMR